MFGIGWPITLCEGESLDVRKLANSGHPIVEHNGKHGYLPTFKEIQHPVPLNHFDPLGFMKKLSEEAKARKLHIEVNNGSLAMLGIMSLVSEAKVPDAVPTMAGLIKKYVGQPKEASQRTLDRADLSQVKADKGVRIVEFEVKSFDSR